MRKYLFAFILTIILCLSSCAKEKAELKQTQLKIGGWSITVEIADTMESRETGLMYRKTLEADCGMLFVYDRDQRLSFWMKNTTIPLSIAYIAADGTIKGIHDMKPLSQRTVDSEFSVRYALEVNQGAFEKHGVKIGDKVEFLP